MRKFDLVISESPKKADGTPVMNRQNQPVRRWHRVGSGVETDKGGIRVEIPPGIMLSSVPGSPMYLFPARNNQQTAVASQEDDSEAPF